MSCYEVDHAHIDLILTVAQKHRPHFVNNIARQIDAPDMPALDVVGNALAYANFIAVCTRYPDREHVAPEPYIFHAIEGDIPLIDAIGAIDCLRYQCTDWNLWHGSHADRATDYLRDGLITLLPGYEDAPTWSFRESERKHYAEGSAV